MSSEFCQKAFVQSVIGSLCISLRKRMGESGWAQRWSRWLGAAVQQMTDWWSTSGCIRASVPHLGFSHTTVFNGEPRLTYSFISTAPKYTSVEQCDTAGDNNIVTCAFQKSYLLCTARFIYLHTEIWYKMVLGSNPRLMSHLFLFTPMGCK